MKILYTADLHIKLGQKNVPKEWQKSRFKKFFEEFCILAEDADLVILGGDIFDRAPNLEELELYFQLVTRLPTKTYIYDGNHEATRKGHTFFEALKPVTEALNKNVTILLGAQQIEEGGQKIDFIPYTDLYKLKTDQFSDLTSDLLCTHVRGDIPPHVTAEVDLTLFNKWKTVLAGDLHSYSNSQRNILYPGSPLTTSFHRKEVKTGVILFDTDDHSHIWIELKLPQLIRKTVDNMQDAIATGFHHTVYEIEGSSLELADIDTKNDLIDKKLVKREYSSTLDLSNKTLREEVIIYLQDIQHLSGTEISTVMGVFDDIYTKTAVE